MPKHQSKNQEYNQYVVNKSKTTSIDFKGYLNRPHREQLLLQAVKDEVEVRLQSSLHNAALINLGKQVQLKRIERLWDVEIKTGGSQFELVSSKTSILEIFERMDVAGKLLIRGKTGSGKTTTMLNLAKELIRRAKADTNYPIPVLFDLGSWKNPHQPITDWLLDELKLKYGVRKNLGKQWLDNKQLLPLLDGLDEVEPSLHEFCVREFNEWLQGTTQPLCLVVCSLWGDIRDSSQQDIWQLSLNGVIQLKPLTEEQIQQYLISLDCTELCQMLEQNANLLELVRTPFLLNITVLSYELLSLAQWQQLSSRAQRVEHLLDTYVQYILHREIQNRWYGKHKTPSAEQTRRWLIYLAQQLQKECRTEFLVGKTPMYWVPTGGQIKSYEESLFILLIIWLIPFIVFGIISWLTFKLSGQLFLGLIVGLILYFVVLLEGNLVKRLLNTGIVISSCIGWYYLQLGDWLNDWLKPFGKQVHHFVLRLIFIQDRHIHWNYGRFLNYCTERLLLQRVGRRYRFIHKLLEDYFFRMSC